MVLCQSPNVAGASWPTSFLPRPMLGAARLRRARLQRALSAGQNRLEPASPGLELGSEQTKTIPLTRMYRSADKIRCFPVAAEHQWHKHKTTANHDLHKHTRIHHEQACRGRRHKTNVLYELQMCMPHRVQDAREAQTHECRRASNTIVTGVMFLLPSELKVRSRIHKSLFI